MKKPTESDLVAVILQRLALLPGVFAWRCNNAGIQRRTKTGREFWSAPPMKGVPDILGWIRLPGRPRVAQFLAIEAKQPGNKATPEQEAFLLRLREAGGVGLLVYSLADLDEGLRAAGFVL